MSSYTTPDTASLRDARVKTRDQITCLNEAVSEFSCDNFLCFGLLKRMFCHCPVRLPFWPSTYHPTIFPIQTTTILHRLITPQALTIPSSQHPPFPTSALTTVTQSLPSTPKAIMPRLLSFAPVVALVALISFPTLARAQALRNASPLVETPSNTPAAGGSASGAVPPEDETPAYPEGPSPSQGFNKPRPQAVSMVKLTQINSSTWQDPEGEIWYTSEYWVVNTAAYEICDVKLAIPLAKGADMKSVRVNSSFALAFGGANEDMGGNTNNYNNNRNNGNNAGTPYTVKPQKAVLTFFFDNAANELTAALSPPYVHALRVRESVDVGFTLAGPPGLAQTGMARVMEARYCDGGIEEQVPKGQQQGQQQQEQQQQWQPNGSGNGGSGQQQGAAQGNDAARRPDYAAGGH